MRYHQYPKCSGKLRYKILPIQGAIDERNRRGLIEFEAASRFSAKMAKSRRDVPSEKLSSS